MAKPRVFVSSTYYDLKHIRASLELFIQSLGFEAILSEKGDIAYSPEIPLDEACYREAAAADIYILIIGGRYGSEISEQKKPAKRPQTLSMSDMKASPNASMGAQITRKFPFIFWLKNLFTLNIRPIATIARMNQLRMLMSIP